jgi:type II secretory ATPase GspE/PulE/Tfp pilus assembly ATPase PilB-like protein
MKKLWRGKGCEKCNGTGYKGRTGIYEVMHIDAAVRDAMLKKFSAADIQRIARANGMSTMVEDGLKKAVAGITTIEEVLRVTNE